MNKRKYLLGLTVSFIIAGCTLPQTSVDEDNSSSSNSNTTIGQSVSDAESVLISQEDSVSVGSVDSSTSINSQATDPSVNSSVGTSSNNSSSPSISTPNSSSNSTSPSVPNSSSNSATSSTQTGEFNTCDLSNYYSNAKCLASSQLKTKLHEIIFSTHKDNISYKNSDSYIADANEDPNNPNNCILFYSGKSMSKTRYNPSSAQPDAWNKEHTWAKSHGDFASALAGRDLHHLMPTYSGVNNARGNNFFDNLKGNGGTAITTFNSYKQSVTVEYSNPSDMSYKTSTAFEPRNAVKGDTARIIFYMALRYSVGGRGTSSPLSLVESGTVNGPYMGKKSVLLQWHLEDPVDDFERVRNEKIFGFQGNRNPFIDHPELVNLLTW